MLVPRWDDTDESDIVVEALVDSLLQLIPADSTSLDVRLHSTAVAERVRQLCMPTLLLPTWCWLTRSTVAGGRDLWQGAGAGC